MARTESISVQDVNDGDKKARLLRIISAVFAPLQRFDKLVEIGRGPVASCVRYWVEVDFEITLTSGEVETQVHSTAACVSAGRRTTEANSEVSFL